MLKKNSAAQSISIELLCNTPWSKEMSHRNGGKTCSFYQEAMIIARRLPTDRVGHSAPLARTLNKSSAAQSSSFEPLCSTPWSKEMTHHMFLSKTKDSRTQAAPQAP
jgi:hypothetical protein